MARHGMDRPHSFCSLAALALAAAALRALARKVGAAADEAVHALAAALALATTAAALGALAGEVVALVVDKWGQH